MARVEADIESRMEMVLHDWEVYRAASPKGKTDDKLEDNRTR
jgi:hypothetical protein